jgi:hypothetical protein
MIQSFIERFIYGGGAIKIMKNFAILFFVFCFSILLLSSVSCCSEESEDDFPGANHGCQLIRNFNDSMVDYTLNYISKESDLIITGTVCQNTVFWAQYDGYNYSYADTIIEVDDYLKGSDLAQIHVITLGSIEDETCIMNGGLTPILSPGDQVLLFLSEDSRNPGCYILNTFQGYLKKDGDRYVGKYNVTVDDVKKSIDAKERQNKYFLFGLFAFLLLVLLIIFIYLKYKKKII